MQMTSVLISEMSLHKTVLQNICNVFGHNVPNNKKSLFIHILHNSLSEKNSKHCSYI